MTHFDLFLFIVTPLLATISLQLNHKLQIFI